MPAYYNEHNREAAEWLRESIRRGLIAPGVVDERSITEVKASDLDGYTQAHFFAGIGGWSIALRLAGWPDDRPVWTGSCPCQPFSAAGKRKGVNDERHLWPVFHSLIQARRPQVVFGEQVASSEVVGTELEASFLVAVQAGDFARANKLAKRLVASSSFGFAPRWIDGVRADLEKAGYSCRDCVLGAHSVGAPHIRQRLYWVADACGERAGRYARAASRPKEGMSGTRHSNGSDSGDVVVAGGSTRGLADADGWDCRNGNLQRIWQYGQQPEDGCVDTGFERVGLADAECFGREMAIQHAGVSGEKSGDREAGGAGVHISTGRLGDSIGSRLEGFTGDERDGSQPGRINSLAAGSASKTGGDGFWSDYEFIPCRDGKSRRIKPGLQPLAHGVSGRVGLLRGYGNAIVPQVAAAFIEAFCEQERRSLTDGVVANV